MYNRNNRNYVAFGIVGILVLALILMAGLLAFGGIPNIDLSDTDTDTDTTVQIVDSDGDGIIDGADNCPNTAGAMTNNGCPPGTDGNSEPETTFSGQFGTGESRTDAQMMSDLGFNSNGVRPVFTGEGISWDHMKWNWQAIGVNGSITLRLPVNYQATVTRNGGEVSVWRGPATINNVTGFTLRYTPAYAADHWVHDDCQLLEQEFAFGQRRSPSYQTVAGNVRCESLEQAPVSTSSCPTTTQQVASLVGGNARQWTAPDWSGGAWVFNSGGSFIVLSVPTISGAETRIDYWNGQRNAADVLDAGESLALSEASFHCH